MTIRKRLGRKPFTTLLWLLVCTAMSAFLLVSFSMWYSTNRLAEELDAGSMALAVRSDQALIVKAGSVEPEERYFTRKDKAWLESLESVKAVRTHAVSAARSPSFSPLLEMDRYKSFASPGNPLPYCNAVVLADFVSGPPVVQIWDDYIYMTFHIQDIFLMGQEYDRSLAKKLLLDSGMLTVCTPNDFPHRENFIVESFDTTGFYGNLSYFEYNKTYVLAGYYDPSGKLFDVPEASGQIFYMNHLERENELLWGFNEYKEYVPGGNTESTGTGSSAYFETMGDSREAYSLRPAEAYKLPAAQPWEGEGERFFEDTPYAIWRTYQDAWEKQQHSLPVIGTEKMEAMYAFMKDRVKIKEGRAFTEEEYVRGERVLIISQKLAELNGIRVGDSLSLTQYLPLFGESGEISERKPGMRAGAYYNDPSVDMLNLTQDYGAGEEEFKVVGLYELLSDWTYGPYDFGPNTIIMPKKAQIAGAFGEIPEERGGRDIYGMLLSIELVNGRMDDFMAQIEGTEYEQQFFAFDQGFEGVQKNIAGMRSSMLRLLLLSAFGWAIFVILYLLMYQGGEKKTMGTMRSLGETRLRTFGYLFGGGLAVALGGILLGSVIGAGLLRITQEGIARDAIAGLDPTMEEAAREAAEARLLLLQKGSSLSSKELILIGLGQFLLLLLALALHAFMLSRRHLRRLREG